MMTSRCEKRMQGEDMTRVATGVGVVVGLWLSLLSGMTPAAAEAAATMLPVAVVTIYPGDEIREDLLAERQVRARRSLTRSYFGSLDGLVGKVAARVIPAGKAIPLNAVRDPYVFKDGARVVLVFGGGALTITGAGQAMQPGVVGTFVDVRNLDTGVVVRGEVQSDGSVRLGGG